MNIILFNSKKEQIARYDNTQLKRATITTQINDLDYLDLEAISNLKNTINFRNTRFIGVNYKNKFKLYRKINYNSGSDTTIRAINIGLDELKGFVIQTREWQKVKLSEAINYVLYGTGYSYDLSQYDDSVERYLYLDYKNAYEAIQEIANAFKIEYDFLVNIQNNNIKNKIVKIYNHIGSETINGRYVYGTNTKDILREENSIDVYNSAVGFGKIINEKTGERLTFRDVVWNNSDKPVNKPKGDIFVNVPDSLNNVSMFNSERRTTFFTFDDIEDASVLLINTYNSLLEKARPLVQFRAEAVNLNKLDIINLGDEVAIIRHDLNIKYQTRIFKIVINLLNEKATTVEFGDIVFQTQAKREKSYTNNINNLNNKFDDLNTKYDDLNNKFDDLNTKYDDLNNKYDDLNDRVTELEGGEVPEPEPEPTNPSYFTYGDNNGNWGITGFTQQGLQAYNSGLETKLIIPKQDVEGKNIEGIFGLGGGVKIQEYIYIGKHIKYIRGFGVFSGVETNYIMFEDTNKKDDGLIEISGQVFAFSNIKSKYVYLPYSVSIVSRDFLYNGNIRVISISENTHAIIGASGINTSTFTSKIIRSAKCEVVFDFLVEVKEDENVIIGLSPAGSIKKDITIPLQIKTIQDTRLKNTRLAGESFKGFILTENVIIQSKQQTILPSTFASMPNLKTVTLNDSIEIIDNEAFRYSNLNEIITSMPNNLTTINNSVFRDTTMIDFVLPDSVLSIGNNSFQNTKQLKSLKLSENLINIGNSALQGTTAVNLELPDTLETIGDSAFGGLQSFKDNTVNIGKNIKQIGTSAFEGCNIKILNFEDKDSEDAVILKNRAFYNAKITDVKLPNKISNSSGTQVFANNELNSVFIPAPWTMIRAFMFVNNATLNMLDMSTSNVTEIQSNSFQNTGLTSVNLLNEKPLNILGYAFNNTKLTSVRVPLGSTVSTTAFDPNVEITYV